jgi:REP element-mobilizing transposase RayT
MNPHSTAQARRRPNRLPGYDYSSPGSYFVTLVTHGRECLFGEVIEGQVHLSSLGEIARTEWVRTAQLRPAIRVDDFVVMPNHLHALVSFVHDSTVGAQLCAPTARRELNGGSSTQIPGFSSRRIQVRRDEANKRLTSYTQSAALAAELPRPHRKGRRRPLQDSRLHRQQSEGMD